MRPPEVFVRELLPEEGARLKQISKRAKYQSKRSRAMILLASSTGMSAPQIAALVRIVFAADTCAPGARNLPLYSIFCDRLARAGCRAGARGADRDGPATGRRPGGLRGRRRLGAPLGVVVVRKLGAPARRSSASERSARGGVRLVNSAALAALGITESDVEQVVAREQEELGRRLQRYFFAVGQAYERFNQTTDEEVRALLEAHTRRSEPAAVPPDPTAGGVDWTRVRRLSIAVPAGPAHLPGEFILPPAPVGLVVFAHGSGSSRLSARNRQVATALNGTRAGDAAVRPADPDGAFDRDDVFDIDLLSGRLLAAVDWARAEPEASALPLGCFGASTGAAAALQAAAQAPGSVRAVVSRGGRPDLAARWLAGVEAPTLLIVGGHDRVVHSLNVQARAAMRCPSELG